MTTPATITVSEGGGEDLVGAHEACQILGVKSANLYKIPGLPAPVAELRMGKVWDGAAIRALAEDRRRAQEARDDR